MLMVSNTYLDAKSDNPFIISAVVSLIFSLSLHSCWNKLGWASQLVVVTFWLALFLVFFDYGIIVGAPIFWLFPIPPLAILLNGIKPGIF
ncbi:MAG: hypothetical protein ACI95C_000837 [Pseudohongiellaceae bacterium]|jgi:hypothetical protein